MKIIERFLIILLVIGIAMLPGCTDKDEEKNDEKNGDATNKLPTASMWISKNVYVGDTVKFDGSNSSDPDGEIVQYNWDFGDGTSAMGQTAEHVYEQVGYPKVVLTVVDDNSSEDSVHDYIRIDEEGNNTAEMEPPSFDLDCRKIGIIPDMAKYVVTISNVSGGNTSIEYFDYIILDHEDAAILDNNTLENSLNNMSSGVVYTSLDDHLSEGDRFTISEEDIPNLNDGDIFQIIFRPGELMVGECILMDEEG